VNARWYDLLDVAPDATEDEIKAAWKAAVADLDPTDRTFRVYNQAAETLLDPRKRAEYDADLAAEQAEANADADAEVEVEVGARTGEPGPESPPFEIAAEPGTAPVSPPADGAVRAVSTWLILAVAALTLVIVGVTVFVWTRPYDRVVTDTSSTGASGMMEESAKAAQAAAERAIVPILSYNALHLDEDQQAAESYMTSGYRKQYADVFAVIKQNAPETKTIVRAEVIASGIVRTSDDRVDVLLFVNRPTTNKQQTEPQVYKDQVTVTMQLVDGDWLVDDMVTSPVGP
jgi:Mce-associated membrane protein